jgi:RHS repeat-associated protein
MPCIKEVVKVKCQYCPLVTIYNKYLYDQVDRKLKTWEQLTNGSNVPDTLRLVAQSHYNEIGQVYSKQLHSKDSVNFMQSIAYSYNERGWLTQASAPLFDVAFYYNTQTNKAYNGNIMYQYWGVPGNLNNHYTYKYDKLNRLMSGVTSADNFQESGITYDTEGNLTALNRYQAGTEIDQLSYSYTVSSNPTNQLQSVVDANASNTGLVSGTTNYTYDGNGNMLTATNTVNTGQNNSITYNLLNLPNVVTVPTGTDTYTYDAAGNKLRMVSVISGVTRNTDYIAGIQYNGSTASDTLSFIQTEEGKAVHNGTTYDYQYYLADNLGNTRITFNTKNGVANTVQQDDYYPFGLEILRAGPHDTKNEYLYNKKELQEDFTEYDYGFRFYDPVVVHWNTIDPLAEESRRWSPYNYVEDDPIRFTDPDGMKESEDNINADESRWADEKRKAEDAKNPGTPHSGFEDNGGHAVDASLINTTATATATVGTAIGNAVGSAVVDGVPKPKQPKKKSQHDTELDKYGQIINVGNVSAVGNVIIGGGIEYGTLETNKGWSQDYQTTYLGTLGYGYSATVGGATIEPVNNNYLPTFSDWRGASSGWSASYWIFSLTAGRSGDAYKYKGFGFGPGEGFKSTRANISLGYGTTVLIGKPYRTPTMSAGELGRFYLNTLLKYGGQ